jgi:hypothetical protein
MHSTASVSEPFRATVTIRPLGRRITRPMALLIMTAERFAPLTGDLLKGLSGKRLRGGR